MTDQPDHRVTRPREQDMRAMLADQHQIITGLLNDLGELRTRHMAVVAELAALRLAADQQHANEPADRAAFVDPAAPSYPPGYDCGGLGCGFQPCICAPVPKRASTGHVMPARALTNDKQAVGLFW